MTHVRIDGAAPGAADANQPPRAGSAWRPLLLSVPLLTLLCGVLFPLLVAVIAVPLFGWQAHGSLVLRDGVPVGSRLIGQGFTQARYFHPRPSAAGAGYDGASSGGSNLGPSNPKLRDGLRDDPATPVDEAFDGVRQLVAAYRRENGLPDTAPVPIDAVKRSGSGLDPHISPMNAALQVPRVARERGLPAADVARMVDAHTLGRQFGVLGEPRVAVLALNLALDDAMPARRARTAVKD